LGDSDPAGVARESLRPAQLRRQRPRSATCATTSTQDIRPLLTTASRIMLSGFSTYPVWPVARDMCELSPKDRKTLSESVAAPDPWTRSANEPIPPCWSNNSLAFGL